MARLIIPDEDTVASFTVTTSQSVFPITYALFAKADLRISVDGTDLEQSDFSFSGTLLEGGGYQGGTVTLVTAVEDCEVLIWREIIPARASQFAPSGSVPVRSIDQALNRQMALIQDLQRDNALAVRVDYGDTPLPPAGLSDLIDLVGEPVSNARLADMATDTIKGRTTAGTGDPEDLTVAQVIAMLPDFDETTRGLVPESDGSENFLKADGTWSNPADATSGESGLMSPADKIKLDGIAVGATANSPDASLVNRANHSGTQAQSTIVNLVSDLAAKIPLTQRAAANGVATLDSGTKVPVAQLPGATTSTAGTLSAADKLKLDAITSFSETLLSETDAAGWITGLGIDQGLFADIRTYGAVADGVKVSDGAATATSYTLTSATAGFTAGDVGKLIVIQGAALGGSAYYSTIAGYTNSTTITLTDVIVTTVSGATFVYGTDNTTAISDAMATDLIVFIPNGRFCMLSPLPDLKAGQRIFGQSRQAAILCNMHPMSGTDGVFNGSFINAPHLENFSIDQNNLIGSKVSLINLYACTDGIVQNMNLINSHRFSLNVNNTNRFTIRRNFIQHKQRYGVYISSFTAGSGGPANSTGLTATVTGGTPLELPVCKYDTNGAGAITSVYFDNNGEYTFASAIPTITFPAVPGSSCIEAIGPTQVNAITIANNGGTGIGLVITENYLFNANLSLTCNRSFVTNNFLITSVYGGAIVVSPDAEDNVITGNTIYLPGWNNTTGAWAPPDTDSTVNSGIEGYGPRTIITDNNITSPAGSGVFSAGQNCVISNNVIADAGGYWASIALYIGSGIELAHYDSTHDSANTLVANNVLYNTAGAAGPMAYGVNMESSSVIGVSVIDNNCSGMRTKNYNTNGAQVLSFRGRSCSLKTTFDVPSLAAGATGSEILITIPGVTLAGDWQVVTTQRASAELGVQLDSYIKADDQVAIRPTAIGAANPASGTAYIIAEELIS